MSDVKSDCRALVSAALNEFIKTKNIDAAQIPPDALVLQTPPDPSMGDIGFPMFAFAKTFRTSPQAIAEAVVTIINNNAGSTVMLSVTARNISDGEEILRGHAPTQNDAPANGAAGASDAGSTVMLSAKARNISDGEEILRGHAPAQNDAPANAAGASDAGSTVMLSAKARNISDGEEILRGHASAQNDAPANAGGASVNSTSNSSAALPGEFFAAGPYVNVKLNKSGAGFAILSRIAKEGDAYGSTNEKGKRPLEGRRVMIEYSAPNTNKPLHLGHMRNDALGESLARILKKAGAEVYKVNIINDRGIHICKSMLAYKLFHEAKGETPESLGIKGDHFVGQCYVEFDKYAKEHPEAQAAAEEMLVQWERGDEKIRALWKTMNAWTLSGIEETYKRTGVSFDKLYFESETYLLGKKIIDEGLSRGIFFKAADGSVRVDVSEIAGAKDGKEHEKVLLRKDGTSVYMTQDLGTAVKRHEDWPFNQMVYVVASEQIYHFKTLFYILKKLGYDWAKNLYHLSYGLVNLPSGRMKSREGTIVDADDLIDSLHADALAEIKTKGREAEVGDADAVAEKIALAALHYYLLNVTPIKDMLFNPEASLSFTGNTGPYLQYMGARIASILRKAKADGIEPDGSESSCALLNSASEWDLIKKLGDFPALLEKAAETLDSSVMAGCLYDVCKAFSKFYEQCPILAAENPALARARLFLADCTLTVLKNAMPLVLVPYLEKM